MADFCVSPTENLLKSIPESIYNVTYYYTTCAGTNPLSPDLRFAQAIIVVSDVAVRAVLKEYCPHDTYLLDALSEIVNINAIFRNITSLIACEPNQQQAQSVLNDGLCNDTFKGIYTIWLGQFVCAAALLFCAILAAFSYPYFNKNEKLCWLQRAEDNVNGEIEIIGNIMHRDDKIDDIEVNEVYDETVEDDQIVQGSTTAESEVMAPEPASETNKYCADCEQPQLELNVEDVD